MKKLKKDFQKNIRDAPNENEKVDKLKSKLVHSEDYRNKIIKTNEKFKDKIAEKDSKLIQDDGRGTSEAQNSSQTKKARKAKRLKSSYKEKIVKDEQKAQEKKAQALAKAKQEAKNIINSNTDLTDSQKADFNKKVDAAESVGEVKQVLEDAKKQGYKRKNYKDTVYTRNRDKKTKETERNKVGSDLSSKKEAKEAFFDKKLRNYQKSQYKLKNKLSEFGHAYNVESGTLYAGAKSSALVRDYLSQGRENAGIESSERIADVSSKLQHGIRKFKLNKKKKTLRKISKLDNRINKRKSKLEFKSSLSELKAKENYQKASAVKKFFKRRQMKRMIAKKYETRFIDRVKKSILKLSKAAKEVVIRKVRSILLIVAAFAALFSGMLSLGSLGGAALNNSTDSVLSTSYLSAKPVLNGINNNLVELENELAEQIENVPTSHPGYDEYIYIDTENIGHNIYELFAYITSKCGGPRNPSEVQPDIVDLFERMYKLEFKEKTEIRTRKVKKKYVDEHGKEHIKEEKEPYEYKILITTLKYKTIGQVAQEVFQGHNDNILHYNTLMKTKGNSGVTYANKDLIQANGGTIGGGQDYEASGDIQKKIVDSCYLTPSPGKGWCAMWVSQVYQNAGLGYLGGNARDLYQKYTSTTDKSKLKVGMLVMVESSSSGTQAGLTYGHVGIYIGDGKVIDNVG
ncbi:CD1108 family mobile element protein, partial [uncultured Parvimonas sp.]|uniref:CD1108 family mobile element protein n=1 Tax=uncultured Parvimonas sp. TaxID=747372 RepID=UPI00280477A9